jgi:hypothetical protein
MSFKSKRKKLQESFFIRYRNWNADGGASWLKKIKTKCKHPLIINYDTRVIKDSVGRYYIQMLKLLERIKE